MLPLNRFFKDDPNNANIIATAAIPKIKANFAGEIDSAQYIDFAKRVYNNC